MGGIEDLQAVENMPRKKNAVLYFSDNSRSVVSEAAIPVNANMNKPKIR